MRKFTSIVLLLSLCLTVTQSLFSQTRPRRVEGTTSAPPPSAPSVNAPVPSAPRRPPVLGGNNSKGQPGVDQPQPQSAPVDDGPEEVGDGETLRVETTLVSIPVSVMDRDGKYIPDLRKEDFRIYEDGAEQEVAYFAATDKPFTVALVLDMSGSTQSRLNEIQEAAIAFVNQLRSDDRVLVVSFDEDVHLLSEATNDRNALRNAIRHARTGDGTSLYDAVDFVINRKVNQIEGRKAIVLFTDGVDTTSRRATAQTTLHDAEELDALIYPVQYNTYQEQSGRSAPQQQRRRAPSAMEILIGVIAGGGINGGIGNGGGGGGGGGRGSSRADYEHADTYLGDLAQKSGARRYRADNTRNLEQTFAQVSEELRRQYSLGYYPQSVAQNGQRRQIKVRVNRPNLAVRSRDSYISNSAPTTGSANARSNPKAKPATDDYGRIF